MSAPHKALLTAALALPGVVPAGAAAQSAPVEGIVALKYLDYRDWQPGAERMRVKCPALHVLKPLSDSLVVEGSLVHDSISGASPLHHDTLSGASGAGITEYRTACDIKVTRYFGDFAVGLGGAASSERDYLSRAASVDVRLWSADRNRTYVLGLAGASDRVDSVNGVAQDRTRQTVEVLAGVTHALSPQDVLSVNLTWSAGHGYYSDPYKPLDARPDRRRVAAALARYNHHLVAPEATLRLSYRYLNDSFGADAHTAEVAWVQPLPQAFTLTPSLRYTTQAAADFYFDPPFPRGFQRGGLYTADTRLAAFGAITVGLKLGVDLGGGWSADLKWQAYRRQSSWHLGGGGSAGLEPFSARWLEIGIAKTL